jgi:hypothetical protein
MPMDWSYSHVIYSKQRSPDEEAAKPKDKRYIYSRMTHGTVRAAASSLPTIGLGDNRYSTELNNLRMAQNPFMHPQPASAATTGKVDWAFSLGTGFVAPGMYPAKFSFDINAPVTVANCTGTTEYTFPDFVVYGLDVAGVSGGQSNLIALDNLYTGTNPTPGICGTGSPLVYWSYDTTTVPGGKITTSPVLSEDGTQVAFLESGGAKSFLHILLWNAGDGAGNGDAVHAAVPSSISAGAAATASVSDTVASLNLTNGGSGYTTAPTVTISGGGGTGATANSTISGGAAAVTITNQGSGYNAAPAVNFSAPTGTGGTTAAGTANVTNGVTSYTVTAGGAGYSSTPTVTVAAPPSGTTATAAAHLTTGVTSINLTNGGTGYTSAPIVVYSTGTGAATANLSQGVGSYTLTSSGAGYASTPTVTVTGDGTGATATATFSASVQTVNLTAGGSGYQTAPTVAFSGAGGATATAAIAGPVSSLTLTGAGAGYTSAPTVTISAPASGTTATATPTMSIVTSVSGVTFINHGSYNTLFGIDSPTVTFSCSGTGCVQNTQAQGTVVTSSSTSTCGASQGSYDVCLVSVTITNPGNYSLTTGSIVMTVNYYQKVTAAVYTVNTTTSTVLSSLALTNGGSGYTSNPTVTFTGGGATTQATATAKINGSVQSVTLTSGGSGYTTAPTVSFSGGSGSGAAASSTIAGAVTGVNVTAVGTGYTTATVTINSASGTGAAATANLTGIVGSITVTNPGSYSSTPTISFNNTGTGGTGAAATASRSSYVSSITVNNAGNNYVSAPTVTISGGSGSGAAATANLSGLVSSVTITSAGTGYTAAPTLSFDGTGTGGSGAAATASINASVATVNLLNAGSGYTSSPTVTFGTGGGGTGAAATATTLDVISGINLVYGGSGYSTVPNVYVNGGGAGASGGTATATVSGGAVTAITLNSAGTGYSAVPTVTFDGPSAGCSGSGSCMVTVPISGNKITNSSPYYDYDNDVLYFGDDNGVLYSVSPVFVGTATTGGTINPTVTSLPVATTSGQSVLTGPVLDSNSGNVFVGASDGKVYAVATPLGSAATSSMTVGEGTGSCGSSQEYAGGITDPVMIDGSIDMLYTYTQNAATSISSSNRAVVTQASTGVSPAAVFGSRVNNVITGGGNFCGASPATTSASQVNVHSPTFDNNYFNGTGTGHMFICDNSTSAPPQMYAITFNGSTMNNAVDATLGLNLSSVATSDYSECAPITEIFHPNADGGPDGTDYMLLGIGRIAGGTGAFGAAIGQAYTVSTSAAMTKGITHSVNTYAPAQDGISGAVVDNISTAGQASSMYFTTLAAGTSSNNTCGTNVFCAVKLTQSGLQ